jgi:hypothetical protein
MNGVLICDLNQLFLAVASFAQVQRALKEPVLHEPKHFLACFEWHH